MNTRAEKLDLFIGGGGVPSFSGKYFYNRHPDDDSIWMEVAEADMDDVNRAVLCAHETWNKSYRKSTSADREVWLNNAADIVERDKEAIASDLCHETGTPIAYALLEVESTIDYLRSSASIARMISDQAQTSDLSARVIMNVREPLGVCASICSSSEPFFNAAKLSAAALMSGNTVVGLASEFAPNASMNLARVYHEAGFPGGAYNQLTGFGAEIGDFLTMHPMVKAVLFHGSSEIGKRISEICGLQMKRCILEFGNKSSNFITADAVLEQAANAVSLFNSRIICEEKVYKPFMALLKKRAEHIRDHQMGDLKDVSTSLGPVLSPGLRDSVRSHIADAEKKGATLISGGHWVGNRCEPTILADVTPEMAVCRSETFGPVTSVYKVRDFEEGLSLANDVDFSLSSSIWTTNINQAMEYSRRCESTATYINANSSPNKNTTFGEIKEPGIGCESVTRNIEQLTNLKSVTIQLPGGFSPKSSPVFERHA